MKSGGLIKTTKQICFTADDDVVKALDELVTKRPEWSRSQIINWLLKNAIPNLGRLLGEGIKEALAPLPQPLDMQVKELKERFEEMTAESEQRMEKIEEVIAILQKQTKTPEDLAKLTKYRKELEVKKP